MANKCDECGKIFIPTRKGHLFCSKFCRERYWRLHNKSYISKYQKNYRLRTPLLCKLCGRDITDRKSGKVYCSKYCAFIIKKKGNKVLRDKAAISFKDYKESIGCMSCGYNKCGACLDFHHMKDKQRRITDKLWYYKGKLLEKELKKCILLCKNCHYELHYIKKAENGPVSSLDKEKKDGQS